ncbi:MAG: AAA family ATPase [Lachnospiraceae bacterium]|nr:AAA family ATPase [Lachnospiraceae bacterium]MBR6977425.1 AAA family ATPase [Lachnospiraceae bacterium]
MIILEVKIDAFGKLKGKTITLRPGLNVITGVNETGKTTIADFVKAVLFGMEEGSEELKHYKPYDFQGVYGGSLRVIHEALVYEIARDFLTGSLSVRRTSDDYVPQDQEKWLRDAAAGLTLTQYEQSGFLAQEAYAKDADQYRETVDKDEALAHELEVQKDFVAARAYLQNIRAGLEAHEDPTVGRKLSDLKDRAAALQSDLSIKAQAYQQESASYEADSSAFSEEIARTERNNQEKGEHLKNLMIQEKQKLAEHTEVNEKAAKRTNIPAILTIAAGLVAAVGAYFYYASYGIDGARRYIFLGIAALSVILFLGGIIWTVLLSVSRAKAKKALEARSLYAGRAEDAEREYQRFLNRDPRVMEFVPDRGAREGQLRARSDELARQAQMLEGMNAERIDLGKQVAEAETAFAKQEVIRNEEKAIDIAVAAFEKLGHLNGGTDEELISERATEILAELGDERFLGGIAENGEAARISVEGGMIFLTAGGRRLLFSELSTSAMQQVLFSVRLAIFEQLDREKRLPLILDESFANLDSNRLYQVMKFLRACGRQTLLFSCQTREKENME